MSLVGDLIDYVRYTSGGVMASWATSPPWRNVGDKEVREALGRCRRVSMGLGKA